MIKRLLPFYCALSFSHLGAQDVQTIHLRSEKEVTIDVSDQRTTTLLFSKPISAIIGRHLTSGEEGDAGAFYQYAHQPGTNLIALTALVPGKDIPMVLVIGDDLFVIQLRHSDRPNLAVKFELPKIVIAKPVKALKPRAPKMPSPVDHARLLELAKGQHTSTSRLPIHRVNHSLLQGSLTTTIDRIVHLKDEDAFAFSGLVINRSRLFRGRLAPGRCKLRANGREHTPSFVQMPDQIPRGGNIRFWVLVTKASKSGIRLDKPIHLLIPTNAR